jgi:predicted nucleic acid-binding protein
LINNLHRAHVLPHLSILIDLDDPEDAFLATQAIQGRADYLITGDHRSGLLKLRTVAAARIITPAEFCRILLN